MPARSGAQYRLMAGVMSGAIKGSGIDKSVAKEFVDKTPAAKRSRFAKHLKKHKKENQ